MNRHLVRYDATAGTWTDIGPFVGIKGETGDKGLKGDNGTPGTNGTNGTNGTDGTDGEDGLSAYELAVAAGFVGDVTAWLASLEGDSAYDIAVAAGFVGDEAAWLESLKGDPGESGTGLDGISVFRGAGVAGGGYYFDMKAAVPKTFTKVYAKQFAGTGDFDFELFINGVSVYAHADVAFGTPFSASGLNIDLPLNAEAYINITPSGPSVTGIWVQFEV
jgi:hypothetical protein